MDNLKVVDSQGGNVGDGGPYFEVAAHVRDILQCDYAIVATTEPGSLHVRAVAGADQEKTGSLAVDLVSKLRNRGPLIVDHSRIVAVPINRGQRSVGMIAGYSSKPGSFTGDDLGKLMVYSNIVTDILDTAGSAPETAPEGLTKNVFSHEELLHLSRLVTVGELSATFAQEVNNPLMLIRGHLRFIDATLSPESPMRINYEVIDRASRKIEEITKRMVDFSRRRTRLVEKCDVAELISDTLRFMQPYFHGQFVDVQIEFEPNLPLVSMDRWHMVQAMVNVLQNASDALTDAKRRILKIAVKAENNGITIAVSDTGKGIAPADLPQIFNPFFTTKAERGTGLGLYITKLVVEDHKGDIRVQSTDRGTTFIISLPL